MRLSCSRGLLRIANGSRSLAGARGGLVDPFSGRLRSSRCQFVSSYFGIKKGGRNGRVRLEGCKSLKDDLHSKLHVELLAGAEAWGAVEVADSVAHQTEVRAFSTDAVTQQRGSLVQCAATAAHGARSRGKIDPVKDVKHVGLQPDFDPLANRDAFENREIQVSKAWGAKPVTGEVANSSRRRRGERGRVPPLRPSASGCEVVGVIRVRITYHIEPQTDFVRRLTALPSHNA